MLLQEVWSMLKEMGDDVINLRRRHDNSSSKCKQCVVSLAGSCDWLDAFPSFAIFIHLRLVWLPESPVRWMGSCLKLTHKNSKRVASFNWTLRGAWRLRLQQRSVADWRCSSFGTQRDVGHGQSWRVLAARAYKTMRRVAKDLCWMNDEARGKALCPRRGRSFARSWDWLWQLHLTVQEWPPRTLSFGLHWDKKLRVKFEWICGAIYVASWRPNCE